MPKIFRLKGEPSEKQKMFFASRAKYVAYGGARGGGKSWALRRKLTLMALRWPGIRMLLIRRSYPELYVNHIIPLREELCGSDVLKGSGHRGRSGKTGAAVWREGHKQFVFNNGSLLQLGYLSCDADLPRYQGAEYDVVAVDEATQITERQFDCLRACVRGVSAAPKRMYLTCNPGGVGHAWVKRLFVDRKPDDGDDPGDYDFIPAKAADNPALMSACPDYIGRLAAIRDPKLRKAWLDGDWNTFEGQFFPMLDEGYVMDEKPDMAPGSGIRLFAGMDYGFDMLALVICAARPDGSVIAAAELRRRDLTLSRAAEMMSAKIRDVEESFGLSVDYIAVPPDLWNRRQDSGRGGVEIMLSAAALPPVRRADARRVPGWRNMREYICGSREDGSPALTFAPECRGLYEDLKALIYDSGDMSDTATEPHDVTHAPDALRYALMSRPCGTETERDMTIRPAGLW